MSLGDGERRRITAELPQRLEANGLGSAPVAEQRRV
jgi:hypothetical protein